MKKSLMRILVFGATGRTGRYLVRQGLKQGYFITAFVRNPASLTEKYKNLAVFKGNILNFKDAAKATENQDCVISVLGNKTAQAFWQRNTIISEAVKNIISAMKKNKVKRFLFVSSFGVVEKIFLPEKIFIKVILGNIFSDIPKQEELVEKSGLDWTIVRPARLTDGPERGSCKAREDLPIGLSSKISRVDLAAFLLKSIRPGSAIRKKLTISY